MFQFFTDLFVSRRYLDTSTDEGPAKPARHPDYYFADGNIVLVAGDVTFRVHSGILCRHSKVFNDVIDPSHPRNVQQEIIDGCPCARLDDNPEDLAVILDCLYDGAITFRKECLPIKYVLAMLRLGCKYELEHIWSEAIRRLTRCFPLSFERFQDVVIKGGTCLAPPVQMVPLDAIDIIGVHRELLFDSLIPPVFYSLAQLHSSDVHATYMDKRLSFTELSYYHDTVETLQAFSIKAFSPILTSTVSRLCTQPSECLQAYAEISKHVVRNGLLNSTGIIRDLDALEADIDSDTELRLCEACLQSFRSHHQDICQQMWNGLGECCGVPCWTKAVRKPA